MRGARNATCLTISNSFNYFPPALYQAQLNGMMYTYPSPSQLYNFQGWPEIEGFATTHQNFYAEQANLKADSTATTHETYYVEEPEEPNSPSTALPELPVAAPRESTRYAGIRETSQKGRHKVLLYEIPGSPRVYVFMYHKRTSMENTFKYQCVECAKMKKCTSVNEDDFLDDPAMLACVLAERQSQT
ncbi:unnamed protein product [Cylicocyclus nassatus]|uniref:Uncharacterized protein n=1 Tax=Cylicocyclus nassatus TaxID=53992 RepID=A0AA36DJV7_CYLNA|nr:unnamed protein product [Cylicocyclus nassatus]